MHFCVNTNVVLLFKRHIRCWFEDAIFFLPPFTFLFPFPHRAISLDIRGFAFNLFPCPVSSFHRKTDTTPANPTPWSTTIINSFWLLIQGHKALIQIGWTQWLTFYIDFLVYGDKSKWCGWHDCMWTKTLHQFGVGS